jgi:hypothetical protein
VKQTEKKANEPGPYKPAMRELKMPAVAERLDLPDHAMHVYLAMVNVLSARTAGIHLDRMVEWFKALAAGHKAVTGPTTEWAKAMDGILPDLVDDAVRVLAAEGLVTTETRTFETPEGETFERVKITMLPVEEWESDKHFMAALALRWPA